jgi:hypothetical protein
VPRRCRHLIGKGQSVEALPEHYRSGMRSRAGVRLQHNLRVRRETRSAFPPSGSVYPDHLLPLFPTIRGSSYRRKRFGSLLSSISYNSSQAGSERTMASKASYAFSRSSYCCLDDFWSYHSPRTSQRMLASCHLTWIFSNSFILWYRMKPTTLWFEVRGQIQRCANHLITMRGSRKSPALPVSCCAASSRALPPSPLSGRTP